jgi:hypothetical protein
MATLKQHIVKQGEYLAKIAIRYRCSPEDIWDHPKNKELREARGDGSILYPSDLLWVPAADPEPHRFVAGQKNTYSVKLPTAKVQVLFESDGKPWAGESYNVAEVEPDKTRTTDGQGVAKFEAPMTLPEVTLHFPARKRSFVVKVGFLDPVEKRSGQVQRLRNLGYLSPKHVVPPEHLTQAIRAFQKDKKLTDTGEADAATKKALVDAHGA